MGIKPDQNWIDDDDDDGAYQCLGSGILLML